MANINKAEIEQRKKDFIEGIGTSEIAEKENIFSVVYLNRLTPDQIMDRYEQVEGQAFLIKCRLIAALRDKFPSDPQFGQYIAEIQNHPTHPIKLGSQPRVNKMIHVGRFCAEHKISDLSKTGILQSAIVELARPKYKEFAGKLLHDIRRKNTPIKEVCRLIEEELAVATIRKQEERRLLGIDLEEEKEPTEKRTIQVEDNVAIEGELSSEQGVAIAEEVIEPSAASIAAQLPSTDTSLMMKAIEEVNVEYAHRYELLLELSKMDASELTEEQKHEELLLFTESYKLSEIKLIPLIQGFIKLLQKIQWKK